MRNKNVGIKALLLASLLFATHAYAAAPLSWPSPSAFKATALKHLKSINKEMAIYTATPDKKSIDSMIKSATDLGRFKANKKKHANVEDASADTKKKINAEIKKLNTNFLTFNPIATTNHPTKLGEFQNLLANKVRDSLFADTTKSTLDIGPALPGRGGAGSGVTQIASLKKYYDARDKLSAVQVKYKLVPNAYINLKDVSWKNNDTVYENVLAEITTKFTNIDNYITVGENIPDANTLTPSDFQQKHRAAMTTHNVNLPLPNDLKDTFSNYINNAIVNKHVKIDDAYSDILAMLDDGPMMDPPPAGGNGNQTQTPAQKLTAKKTSVKAEYNATDGLLTKAKAAVGLIEAITETVKNKTLRTNALTAFTTLLKTVQEEYDKIDKATVIGNIAAYKADLVTLEHNNQNIADVVEAIKKADDDDDDEAPKAGDKGSKFVAYYKFPDVAGLKDMPIFKGNDDYVESNEAFLTAFAAAKDTFKNDASAMLAARNYIENIITPLAGNTTLEDLGIVDAADALATDMTSILNEASK